MLSSSLADPIEAAEATASATIQTPESLGERSVYQVVQEGPGGARFLQRYSKLSDAMTRARVLNARDGKAYKTVLWGSGLPVQRGKGQFRGDNILPSLVLHPAAVTSHPEVLPISAVYRRQSEVVFTPTGEPVPTTADRFIVPSVPGTLSGVSLSEALAHAERHVRRTGQDALVFTARKNDRTLTPAFRAHRAVQQGEGLGDLAFGIQISPVTPADVLRRRLLRRVM